MNEQEFSDGVYNTMIPWTFSIGIQNTVTISNSFVNDLQNQASL